ncbi:hypothetical protein SAMN06265795_11479 [Noviherbaspirillum humi]|uniref:Uncharacterized protein n=1 Tax=Noviherbaspirillum humi TaxID=1688639 RepID=A0A239K019_9BURK|nr:hypothetical protein [Noviherbaspirillum humi]SNT11687.1 hypothetical protein SAMN06265795_11479 [Noviherbaspirillum humi]
MPTNDKLGPYSRNTTDLLLPLQPNQTVPSLPSSSNEPAPVPVKQFSGPDAAKATQSNSSPPVAGSAKPPVNKINLPSELVSKTLLAKESTVSQPTSPSGDFHASGNVLLPDSAKTPLPPSTAFTPSVSSPGANTGKINLPNRTTSKGSVNVFGQYNLDVKVRIDKLNRNQLNALASPGTGTGTELPDLNVNRLEVTAPITAVEKATGGLFKLSITDRIEPYISFNSGGVKNRIAAALSFNPIKGPTSLSLNFMGYKQWNIGFNKDSNVPFNEEQGFTIGVSGSSGKLNFDALYGYSVVSTLKKFNLIQTGSSWVEGGFTSPVWGNIEVTTRAAYGLETKNLGTYVLIGSKTLKGGGVYNRGPENESLQGAIMWNF